MEAFLNDHITTLGLGIVFSIAIYCAYKTGQLVERSTVGQGIQNFELEKLKLKTESKLEKLFKLYGN